MNLKSKNPFLGSKAFNNTSRTVEDATVISYEETMTVSGAMNKSFILLATLLFSAIGTWLLAYNGYNPMLFAIGGGIVGFVLVLIASFKPETSTWVAPGYALFEGLFIGGISAFFEAAYPGIVIQAVSCTFVTFIICFALYKYQIVKVTEKFKSIVTNPLTWDSNQPSANRMVNEGAVLYNFNKVIPKVAGAINHEGVLWTPYPKFFGNFLYKTSDYHIADFNFYYLSVRKNASDRTTQYINQLENTSN